MDYLLGFFFFSLHLGAYCLYKAVPWNTILCSSFRAVLCDAGIRSCSNDLLQVSLGRPGPLLPSLQFPSQCHSGYAIWQFSESVIYPSPLSAFYLSQYALLISQFQQRYLAYGFWPEYSEDDAKTFINDGLQSLCVGVRDQRCFASVEQY